MLNREARYNSLRIISDIWIVILVNSPEAFKHKVSASNFDENLCPWYTLPSVFMDRYFADKGPYSQSYDFSSCHVWMGELDHKESWAAP